MKNPADYAEILEELSKCQARLALQHAQIQHMWIMHGDRFPYSDSVHNRPGPEFRVVVLGSASCR